MPEKYFIQTFGCAQNVSDSERIASMLENRGMTAAEDITKASYIIINTCMVREMAENRVYGLLNNLKKIKIQNTKLKIILTGCMVGMAVRDPSGKYLRLMQKKMPQVDEFLPIEEVGFDHAPLRISKKHALVPISNGCNNFCTFCVVPFSRGREVSRPYQEIISECKDLARNGYEKITLLGMNVNSYGADLIFGKENTQTLRNIDNIYFKNPKSRYRNTKQIQNLKNKKSNSFRASNFDCLSARQEFRMSQIKPVYVKYLGRFRIPTLFPLLLDEVCKIKGIREIDFMSSNPWDFSDELIEVIAKNPKISRNLHIAIQSGSNRILKKMNRWYTRKELLNLFAKLKFKIKNLKISTDIIVGFCTETEKDFQDTVDLVKKVGFYKAYISMYSQRPMTAAGKVMKDDVPHRIKKKRWRVIEELINKPQLKKASSKSTSSG